MKDSLKSKLKSALSKSTLASTTIHPKQSPKVSKSQPNKPSKPHTVTRTVPSHSVPPISKTATPTILTALQRKMSKKLSGSQFRLLNESLYTTPSALSYDLFQTTPTLFDVYHAGFAAQVDLWPINPVDIIIESLRDTEGVIVDMGCGEAKIAEVLGERVVSYDLVSRNERVVACDIAKTPLGDACVDFVVFALSLMGTNFNDFLREAARILKIGYAYD